MVLRSEEDKVARKWEARTFQTRLMHDAGEAMAKLQVALEDSNLQCLCQKVFDSWNLDLTMNRLIRMQRREAESTWLENRETLDKIHKEQSRKQQISAEW